MKNYKKFLSEDINRKQSIKEEWNRAYKILSEQTEDERDIKNVGLPPRAGAIRAHGDYIDDDDRRYHHGKMMMITAPNENGEFPHGAGAFAREVANFRKYGGDPRETFVAARIHDEWRKRNPKADWNAAQHADYHYLPQAEQEKDIAHVRVLERVMGNPLRLLNPAHHHDIADAMGSELHDEWRRGHESRGGGPRIKGVSTGGQVDINVPWQDLHPEWKRENYDAGHAAIRSYAQALRLGL